MQRTVEQQGSNRASVRQPRPERVDNKLAWLLPLFFLSYWENKMTTKVKCLKVEGDILFKQFEGKVGVLSGNKGVSGLTERVDFDGGGSLFLRPDQFEEIKA